MTRTGLILRGALLLSMAAPVVYGTPAQAQYGRGGYGGGGYDRGYRNSRPYNDQYDQRYYRDHHSGGIGPGKGALIGGGAGALIGGLLGGGMKGALIGGGIGAGGGALLGKANQNSRNRRDYRDYNNGYRRY